MIAHIEPLNCGFAMTDPSDPRWQYVKSLHRRFGEFLHRASISLQQQGEQNTVDAVFILVRNFTHRLRDYPNTQTFRFALSVHSCWSTETVAIGMSSSHVVWAAI